MFPADGSVKVDKWATGEHLKETGVGEVSLSVTAVPPIYSFGVDVVFVTDVSNSMAWVAGTTRAPGSGETSKLQNMQKAVSDFSEVFLSNNITGNIRGNNTVTFTTFGGWDADVTSTSYEYTDPTRTLFIANRDIDDIKSKVNAITFNMPESNTYYLTFNGQKSTNSSDRNYGGTNYDVGMMQAYNAINNVKSEYYTQTGENYDSTSRQIYVIFVTDGAPTLYNGLQYKPVGSSSPAGTMVYTDPNTNKQYSYNGYNGTNDVTQAQWYNYIKNTDHAWATKVYNMDHVTNMSCIGIDFPNGGFQANTDYWIFTKAEGYPLENVLSGIVTNQTLDVGLAEDQLELAENLASIAKEVSSMSEGSYTIDLMGTNFDLQRASTVTDANGNVIKLSDYGITPTIKVMRYPTYHKSDVGTRMNGVTVTESMIGQYYGTPSVIETVTFSADGTQAFSDRKSGNILKNGIIDASFFTYNTTDHDVVTEKGKVLTPKSLLWYLGTLSEDEIRLTYNIYLDGSMEGEREEGSFATNNEAKLYYKDYKGVQREKTYPVPYLPWDEAKLAYELYLVDTDGNPINLNGDKVSFENREVMSELQTVEAYLNTSYEIDYDLLQKILPEGYYLYNEDSSFDIFMASGSHGEAKVNDDTKTTIVSIPEDATTDTNGNVKASQYNDVKVSFAIIKLQINPDVVVLDYGKTILSDPLANDNGSFVINGLTTTPPSAGKMTADTVKLSNGVAKVLDGTVDKNTIVPLGKNVVTPFALSGTNYVYPEIGKVTSSNNTGAARYVVESNGKITKYAAGSTSGTQIAASLADGDYVIDGSYAITNLKGTLYIVKDYQLDSKTIETKVERTYYELGDTVSSTRSISNDSNNKTVLATLPDGTVVSAYYSTQGFFWTTYYINLYFGNTSIGSFSSASTTYNNYTYKNIKNKNGNDITVTAMKSTQAVLSFLSPTPTVQQRL
ncbi:MAG: hypothetical protein MJ168_04295 [Clostridia bacterium]|nr:hypothetical protein [Clostridia bacterium]